MIILSGEMPESGDDCEFCKWRDETLKIQWVNSPNSLSGLNRLSDLFLRPNEA